MTRFLPLLLLAACARDGRLGRPGADGTSCSVEQLASAALVTCGDGIPVRIGPGAQGLPGRSTKGPRGEPGAPPAFPSAAVRLVDAPSCPGGVLLQRGVDGSGDGRLQDEEVTTEARFCPPPPSCTRLESSLVITSSWELAELFDAGCSEVLDDLQVVIPGLPDLKLLGNVRAVGGALVVASTDVASVDGLAALREVGTLALVDNVKLRTLEALSGLERAREIDLEGMPQLESLRGLESVTATDDLILATVGMQDLEPLAGLSVAPLSISLRGNPRLARAALPATTGTLEAVEISGNPELTSLAGLRPAGIVQALVVRGNPRLPTCEALQLLDALVVKPAFVDIGGNDDAGVCP